MDSPEATTDTIRFIRRITSDGEVSAEEVWAIADFLNRREDCAAAWPGTVLVPLLADIWSDGELSEDELGTLAATLQGIEQTWSSTLKALACEPSSGKPAPEHRIPHQDLPFELPRLAIQAEVESSSSGDTYLVDLFHHTCTCPDFRRKRMMIADLSPSRCCKHLCAVLTESEEEWPPVHPLVKAIVEELSDIGKGAPYGPDWYLMGNAGFCVAEGPWVNVFLVDEAGNHESCGFHVEEGRWSYGYEPPGAEWIAAEILRVARER